MRTEAGGVTWHVVEHGNGAPVVVLHGAGVDHREPEACFDPTLDAVGGLRRLYPDLPGSGRTSAPASLSSADDVLAALIALVDELAGPEPVTLIGHSAGAYYAQGLTARSPERVAGLALVCPLLDGTRDVPEHRPLVADDSLGDEAFRGYFVIQTPEMLDRYERFVAPALPLADRGAAQRIGSRWRLTVPDGEAFPGPTLVVAGRLDSTVGHVAAAELLDRYPRGTLAVLDDAGHALPHEQPAVLSALLTHWLARCHR